jgi:hypothetical protein
MNRKLSNNQNRLNRVIKNNFFFFEKEFLFKELIYFKINFFFIFLFSLEIELKK